MGATPRLLRPLQMESGKNPHFGVIAYFLVLFISKALEELFEQKHVGGWVTLVWGVFLFFHFFGLRCLCWE